jgi:peptide/nickel transport system ATP-binding protein
MTALNPVYTIGFQIVESLRLHLHLNPSEAKARAIELLEMVEIPNPEGAFDKYPHQFSGGQRQRIMIAIAISCDPVLLIADEPTTALDVTVQAEILDLLRNLRHRLNSAIVLITHDMGVVADLADKIIVMKDGEIVEAAPIREIFNAPKHPYTQQLLGAVPRLQVSDRSDGADPFARTETVLKLEHVAIEYPKHGRVPAFRAADDINLEIRKGEVLGLVGESGSGKTTIGRAVVGLLPVVEGSLSINGHDLAKADAKGLRDIRRHIGIVFQDPGSSLNPRFPIGQCIGEPLLLTKQFDKKAIDRRVEELLDQVELPRSFRNRYPHELSGGQRQRVGIARALALEPSLLVADEPTSALDVSVQARFLDLLQEIQQEQQFACLFVSHDLAVVDLLADRIAVMHRGKLVEQGSADQILRNPQDPYTQKLIAAVPVPDPDEQQERREARAALLAESGIS